MIGGCGIHEQGMLKKKKRVSCYAQMQRIRKGTEHGNNYKQISNSSYVKRISSQ